MAWADDFVRGVYPATPPSSFTLYAFDPELLGAWDTPLYEYEKKFIPEKYQKLPILGGWYGQGFTPDREMLMASGLKKAFILENNFFSVERIQAALASMGLTLLSAPDGLEKTPQTFRAMGQIFNRSTRGEELAIWAEKALESLKILKSLPNERKPRVYFAMDADGLASSCQGEARSIFIDFAGGRNCLTCADALKPGRPRISFEELMAMDPDTILVESVELLKVINQSPHWARLRAKKEGRVYLVPRGPFSWNGHPTLTALMGARWLANLLHPDLYPLDVVAEAKEFNRLFFRLELTDQEVRELLGQNLAS
ncbi:MAG: ABC transporter substrate-binding protein [Deltaproteobacteria bacterium]|nr:ABC transporter substrate-binding protein [Deltaproteobacteria bacterium]